jgi:hypothetical protein
VLLSHGSTDYHFFVFNFILLLASGEMPLVFEAETYKVALAKWSKNSACF